jgi:hypothetical protein
MHERECAFIESVGLLTPGQLDSLRDRGAIIEAQTDLDTEHERRLREHLKALDESGLWEFSEFVDRISLAFAEALTGQGYDAAMDTDEPAELHERGYAAYRRIVDEGYGAASRIVVQTGITVWFNGLLPAAPEPVMASFREIVDRQH